VDPTIGEDLQSTLYFATANKMTGQLRGNNITTGDLFNPFPLGVGSQKARGEVRAGDRRLSPCVPSKLPWSLPTTTRQR
jgi:hypothetical protein